MNWASSTLLLQTCIQLTNGCKMLRTSESLTIKPDSNLCNPIELLLTAENSSTIKTIKLSGLGLTNSDFLKNPRIFVEKFPDLVTHRCKKNRNWEFYYFKTQISYLNWLVRPISSLKWILDALQLFMQIRKSEDTRLTIMQHK